MRIRIIGLIVVVGVVLALLPGMLAQTSAQSEPANAPEAAQSAEEEASSSAETQQENAPAASQSPRVSQRRDPFKMLVVVDPIAADPSLACVNKTGKGKLLIGQLQVQGFSRSVDGTWIAVVDNNTNRAYFLRAEDVLCNGVVSAVNPDSIVFMEETTDARGQKGTREVVKQLPED